MKRVRSEDVGTGMIISKTNDAMLKMLALSEAGSIYPATPWPIFLAMYRGRKMYRSRSGNVTQPASHRAVI